MDRQAKTDSERREEATASEGAREVCRDAELRPTPMVHAHGDASDGYLLPSPPS